MNNVAEQNLNVITISERMGVHSVGSCTLLSSDFNKAGAHIAEFAKALHPLEGDVDGVVEVKEVLSGVVGLVDGYEVIKFMFNPMMLDLWMVGSSSALPTNIGKAKAYVKAMVEAYALASDKKAKYEQVEKAKKPEYVVKLNDYMESAYGGAMKKVFKAYINNKAVYTAEFFQGKWTFTVGKQESHDIQWMLAFTEAVKGITDQVKLHK